MDKEDSWFQHTRSSGKGCLYSFLLHNIFYELNTIAIWQVFDFAGHFKFRYKNMDSKFRHHYEVIQEVKYL